MQQKKAFTLIELLVVIAIIAILAAILFPVFAKAKDAAKTATAISNMKQLGLGLAMYSGDSDDYRVLRNRQDYTPGGPVTNEYSWKQLIAPYVKNQGIWKDPSDMAASYLDVHSDPVARAYWNWTPVNPDPSLKFVRGYSIANIFINGSFADNKAVSVTGLSDPAGVLSTLESKEYSEDMGPYLQWRQSVDAGYTYMGAAAPSTGLKWNWGGGKWDNKGTVAAFQDGHAKRLLFSAMCGREFTKLPVDSSEIDFWGMAKSDQTNYGWATGMCDTLPVQFN